MAVEYTIQGFNFHQPDLGFQLMEGSTYAPAVNPRRVNIEITGMHGQVPMWNDELSAQKLTLRVRIRDQDPAGLQAKWEHLRGLMWTGSNQGLTIRRVVGTQVTSAFGQLESMTEPDFWCAAGMIDTVILLNIPYGRWQSIETYEQALSTNTLNQQVDFVRNSTAPVTNMLFRIQGPVTTTGGWVDVRDGSSQTGFRVMPGVVSSSQYVIVDPENYKAWVNNSSSFTARETDVSQTLIPVEKGMLVMVSNPTFVINGRTNDTDVTRSTGATSTTMVIQGRRTYI